MALTKNIAAMYRRPRQVIRGLLSMGQREDRALMFLALGCLLMFVAQWPRLAREANENPAIGTEICGSADPLTTACDPVNEATQALVGSALMGWIFIVPVMCYLIAGLTRLIARVLGGKGTWYSARLALFWALLAATPMWLLNGLAAGLVGPGIEVSATGTIATGVFFLFWMIGLIETERVGAL